MALNIHVDLNAMANLGGGDKGRVQRRQHEHEPAQRVVAQRVCASRHSLSLDEGRFGAVKVGAACHPGDRFRETG